MNIIKNILDSIMPMKKNIYFNVSIIDNTLPIPLKKEIDIRPIEESIEKRVENLIEKIFKPWYIENVSINSLSDKSSHHPLFIFTQNYSLSIHNYYKYLLKSTKLSIFFNENIESIFISIIVYLDKIKKKLIRKNRQHEIYLDYNIFYIFITLLCLSVKYHIDDIDYLSCTELILKLFDINIGHKYLLFENVLLEHLEYNLFVPVEEYHKYYKLLFDK